jgi:glucan biosynthesis protein C
MNPTNIASAEKAARVDFIDWLRVITTLCVFIFHSARFFDSFGDWHVKNATFWIGGNIIVGFMSLWIMPMFMILAGASTYYSLRSRSAGQYTRERVLRLLVPFLFGLLIIVVPQNYYEMLYHGKSPSTDLWNFYCNYVRFLPFRFAHFGFYHLWFLAVLFVFSLICLPFFLGRSQKSKSLLSVLTSKINSPWKLIPLLILPLALADILVYPDTFWGNRNSFGGWCLVAHLLFFISGYVVFSNPNLGGWMGRLGRFAIIGAIVALIALKPLLGQLFDWKTHYGSVGYAAAQTALALLSWCLLIGFITLAYRFLDFKNRFLAYASQAVLPFYILHQTVIITVGYYVVRWKLNPALKYQIILPISFGLIIAIYDLLVRRMTILRFLLGMRAFHKA